MDTYRQATLQEFCYTQRIVHTLVDFYKSGTDVRNPFHVFPAVELSWAVWPDHVWSHFVGIVQVLGQDHLRTELANGSGVGLVQ